MTSINFLYFFYLFQVMKSSRRGHISFCSSPLIPLRRAKASRPLSIFNRHRILPLQVC